MGTERRTANRLPVGIYLTQYIHDRGFRCFTTNLSETGAFMNRLVEPIERRDRIVQVELPIAAANESLWIKGEIVYDCLDPLFHGTGLRFVAMAQKHQRLLRDYLEHERTSFLRSMIQKLCDGIGHDRRPVPATGSLRVPSPMRSRLS